MLKTLSGRSNKELSKITKENTYILTYKSGKTKQVGGAHQSMGINKLIPKK